MLELHRLRADLNSHPVDLSAIKAPESMHFYDCPQCGALVDRRLLGDVLWHSEAACLNVGGPG